KGQMTITLISEKNDRYQGIVSIEHDTLQACLEEYFERSEQLKTKLWLRASTIDGKAVAAGMLLQVLPENGCENNEFEHLVQLTQTIKDEELFTLDANTLLYRLYHQEQVKLFEPAPVSYACTCSYERSALALQAIGQSEVAAMQQEDGSLTMDCDYCGKAYRFEPLQLKEIFAPVISKTLH
ncbi:MAG: Hsp33 family molecular chaperone HslO, partial [Vibrionaceae bacterium]